MFAFVLLERCTTERLIESEQEWLDRFPDVFNAGPVVEAPMRGRHHTLEKRMQISDTMRRRGLKPVNAGLPHTAETRAKMSASRLGHAVSSEARMKIRVSSLISWARGDHPKIRSEEVRRKTSESMQLAYAEGRHSRIQSPESIEKMRAGLRRYYADPTARATTSEATRIGMACPEVRAKLHWPRLRKAA